MERQQTSRSKVGNKENDFSLKVFCLTPTVTTSDSRDTSVYEIDIQSDFEFHSTQMKKQEFPVGVSKVSTKDSRSGSGKRKAKTREHKSSFFEAYYPNLVLPPAEENETQLETVKGNETQLETVKEIQTESEAVRESETQSETVEEINTQVKEIQTESEAVRENETQSETLAQNEKSQMTMTEEKKESPVEKVDKENQSPSVHHNKKLQQHLKSFLIETFFSKNKNDLKAMFKNYEKKLDTNELHLHHHEHHHHYYFDSSFLSGGSSDSKEEHSKSERSRENGFHEEKMFEKVDRATDYASESSSNQTFTHVRHPKDPSTPNAGVSERPEATLQRIPSFPLKSSASEESVALQKSDLIKSHVYSDTDVAKSESQEVESSVKESKKSSRSNYSLLVNSLKNLNQLRSPVIITDQQTVPKFSYITCECTSVDTLANLSSISLFNSEHLEEAEETERTSCDSEESIKGKGARRIEVRKSERDFYFDLWKTKLKADLRQIKQDLQGFEDIYFNKKDSFPSRSRMKTESPGTRPDHKIAVYSRKTFIMGTRNLCLEKNCQTCKELQVTKKNKAYEESLWKKTALCSADRKAHFKKKRTYRSL